MLQWKKRKKRRKIAKSHGFNDWYRYNRIMKGMCQGYITIRITDKSIGFDKTFKVKVPKPWDDNEFRHNLNVAVSEMRAIHSDMFIMNYLDEIFTNDHWREDMNNGTHCALVESEDEKHDEETDE